MEAWPNLYREFSNIKPTAESVLHFINRFGPLTKQGQTHQGEDIESIIVEAEKMRKFIEAYANGHSEAIVSLVGTQTAKLRGMECSISVDAETTHLRVQLMPDCLQTALWLQMFNFLSDLKKIRSCRLCGEWFDVGPGTKRRGDAQFCTQEHKTRYFSKKRTPKKEGE